LYRWHEFCQTPSTGFAGLQRRSRDSFDSSVSTCHRTGVDGMDRPDGREDHRGVDRLAALRDEVNRRAQNRRDHVYGCSAGLAAEAKAQARPVSAT